VPKHETQQIVVDRSGLHAWCTKTEHLNVQAGLKRIGTVPQENWVTNNTPQVRFLVFQIAKKPPQVRIFAIQIT
jgi:hypothetical protein